MESSSAQQKSPKLLDQVRAKMRLLHHSIRTEESYVHWIARYIRFHGLKHPRNLGTQHIEAFLTDLAVRGHVAASTQNQAFSALLFLYRHVLEIELPRIDSLRARGATRLPVVLSIDEVRLLLDRMAGRERLMGELLYGSGMRLLEVCRLRLKDVDMARWQLMVRDGKGEVDRAVPLPRRCEMPVREQIRRVETTHEQDLALGHGRVWLPYAYARKWPGANRELVPRPG
jgi:site-specific recombinase XerD